MPVIRQKGCWLASQAAPSRRLATMTCRAMRRARQKCTLDDNALVEIWTWSNNPPDTTDQQEWAYSESHPFVQLGPTPDCCIVGTSPAPWVAEISGDETYVASVRASDWSTVQVALDGQVVTNPPASWSQYPVPAGSP